MKKTLLTLGLTFIWIFGFPCGGEERWDVKTCTDIAASKINTTPIISKITDLVNEESGKIGNSTPRHAIEFTIRTVTCYISYWKYEADSDIHIVMNDIENPSITMIAEIPNPNCDIAKTSKYEKEFINTRNKFLSFKKTAHTVKSGTYILTGVAFFDKIHGQKGVAKNGIEIHPLLSIQVATRK
jgi:catabolite regulation protein CreA